MKFPYTTSYAEVFAIVHDHCPTGYGRSLLRPGQSICNAYDIPKELDEKIYQMRSHVQVAKALCEWFHREGYQQ